RLHLVVGGAVRLSLDLPAAHPGATSLALPPGLAATFDHRNHEHQMELALEGPAASLPDPFRADALVLEAELEAA
ncbi:MAG: hypothetical protein K2X74_03270, partial [Acetobacteraceae bacterium]|nr:hypothetical protein [Acetobacteraceae bacterium]